MKELESEDPQSYRNFIRMDKQDFDELLTKVTPFIQNQYSTILFPLVELNEPFNLLFGEINCIFSRHFVIVLLFLYYFPIITEYLEPNDLGFPSKSH